MIKLTQILSEIKIYNPSRITPEMVEKILFHFDNIIDNINDSGDDSKDDFVNDYNEILNNFFLKGTESNFIEQMSPQILKELYQNLLKIKQKYNL